MVMKFGCNQYDQCYKVNMNNMIYKFRVYITNGVKYCVISILT